MTHIADKLFFDLETLPTVDPGLIADIAASISPPASMKKPETIARWEAEEKPQAIDEAIRKTALDGGTGRLASICWALGDGEIVGAHSAGDDGWSIERERELIKGFFSEAHDFSVSVAGAVLVGHNILGFDIRWLWKRAIVLGVQVPDWWPLDARPWSQDVADTMTMWEGANGRISQDRLGRVLGLGGKGDVDGSQVADLWAAGRYDDVLSYNADDVGKVRKIWARITQFDGQIEPIQAPVEEVKPVVEKKKPKRSRSKKPAAAKPAQSADLTAIIVEELEKMIAEGIVEFVPDEEEEVSENAGPAMFFEEGDEELEEEAASVETPIAEVVEEKPKTKGKVIPKFLKDRGLAA